MRIFARIRGIGQATILGLAASVKVREVVCSIILNQSCYSEEELLFYVQREILAEVEQCISVETKEEVQAYAVELVNEKSKRQYQYFNAYPTYPGAMVSLRKGLTLAEAREWIMFWGDIWAVDEASAINLCNALGGVSSGPTRDGNPNNAMHYHAVMSHGHHHIYFELDKNLLFVP